MTKGHEGEEPSSQELRQEEFSGSQEAREAEDKKGPDFDYLLTMPMKNLTQEKVNEICEKSENKRQELLQLQATSIKELWKHDLDEFMKKLDEVEQNDIDEGAKGGEKKGKMTGQVKADTLPSKSATRYKPKVGEKLKAAAAKVRKAAKNGEGKVEVVKDEFDAMAEEDSDSSDYELMVDVSKPSSSKPAAQEKAREH